MSKNGNYPIGAFKRSGSKMGCTSKYIRKANI
ncbi:hypothetical protein BJV38_001908 [Clostridium beijerinckii]|nr:hypothetical protein [Clostridium beijerinckii]NRT45065.1 hypothetical protein [Clostridium beijerinckii]NRZ20939.1 hypothetical protein [Clostridium beijerinckii]